VTSDKTAPDDQTTSPSVRDSAADSSVTAPPSEAAVPAPTTPSPSSPLPPDPAAYDSERAVHARARGLPAPYIAGGVDPDPETGLAEERRYRRLLIFMVAAIVLGGFVLGFIGLLIGGAAT